MCDLRMLDPGEFGAIAARQLYGKRRIGNRKMPGDQVRDGVRERTRLLLDIYNAEGSRALRLVAHPVA